MFHYVDVNSLDLFICLHKSFVSRWIRSSDICDFHHLVSHFPKISRTPNPHPPPAIENEKFENASDTPKSGLLHSLSQGRFAATVRPCSETNQTAHRAKQENSGHTIRTRLIGSSNPSTGIQTLWHSYVHELSQSIWSLQIHSKDKPRLQDVCECV